MTHRHLTAAAALAACTALLLTGCGGDDGQSKDDDKIAGAEGGDKTASPSTSPGGKVDRPDIELPKDLKLIFEGGKTGDREKDAVLYDSEQLTRATHMAIARSAPLDKAYQFYATGKPAADTENYIKQFVKSNTRSTGIARFYDRKVSIDDDGWASITYCEDQGKGYSKNLDTGKVDVTPVTDDAYVLYSGLMRKNEKGIWVTEKMTSTRGAAKCQP